MEKVIADALAESDHDAGKGRSAHTFGPVTVRPEDPRYAELVVGDNQRWAAHPEYVQMLGSTEQVVQAVQAAVRAGKRISVRSGGHCYEDFVSHPDVQVIIDMSEMNNVYYDAAKRAFAIEPGARLLDVYETLYKRWGVTIPGGSCYSVGSGGHICGGGYGLLSRKHGLTVDHLYAVEVVVVDRAGVARAVVASRDPKDPNHDLWWAHTGGGGGNFGVITRYWMRSPEAAGDDPGRLLPNPPDHVLLGGVSFPWADLDRDRFRTLVANFGRWHEDNSAPGASATALSAVLGLNHHSNGSVSMFAQVDATAPDADGLLDDFFGTVGNGVDAKVVPITARVGDFGPMPHLVTPQRLPWLHATRFLGTNTPVLTNPTLRADHKSAYLRRRFSDAHIDTMYQYLSGDELANPNAMVVLLSLGGRTNSVPAAATAVAQRDSVFKALFQSFWADPADDARNLAWTRGIYRDVFADSGGVPVSGEITDGCYINYPDIDLGDPQYNSSGVPWHTLYYKDNYPRLQRVKARWDPTNKFRHAQSIQPPPA